MSSRVRKTYSRSKNSCSANQTLTQNHIISPYQALLGSNFCSSEFICDDDEEDDGNQIDNTNDNNTNNADEEEEIECIDLTSDNENQDDPKGDEPQVLFEAIRPPVPKPNVKRIVLFTFYDPPFENTDDISTEGSEDESESFTTSFNENDDNDDADTASEDMINRQDVLKPGETRTVPNDVAISKFSKLNNDLHSKTTVDKRSDEISGDITRGECNIDAAAKNTSIKSEQEIPKVKSESENLVAQQFQASSKSVQEEPQLTYPKSENNKDQSMKEDGPVTSGIEEKENLELAESNNEPIWGQLLPKENTVESIHTPELQYQVKKYEQLDFAEGKEKSEFLEEKYKCQDEQPHKKSPQGFEYQNCQTGKQSNIKSEVSPGKNEVPLDESDTASPISANNSSSIHYKIEEFENNGLHQLIVFENYHQFELSEEGYDTSTLSTESESDVDEDGGNDNSTYYESVNLALGIEKSIIESESASKAHPECSTAKRSEDTDDTEMDVDHLDMKQKKREEIDNLKGLEEKKSINYSDEEELDDASEIIHEQDDDEYTSDDSTTASDSDGNDPDFTSWRKPDGYCTTIEDLKLDAQSKSKNIDHVVENMLLCDFETAATYPNSLIDSESEVISLSMPRRRKKKRSSRSKRHNSSKSRDRDPNTSSLTSGVFSSTSSTRTCHKKRKRKKSSHSRRHDHSSSRLPKSSHMSYKLNGGGDTKSMDSHPAKRKLLPPNGVNKYRAIERLPSPPELLEIEEEEPKLTRYGRLVKPIISSTGLKNLIADDSESEEESREIDEDFVV